MGPDILDSVNGLRCRLKDTGHSDWRPDGEASPERSGDARRSKTARPRSGDKATDALGTYVATKTEARTSTEEDMMRRWLCFALALSLLMVGSVSSDSQDIRARVLETSAQPGSVYTVYLWEEPFDISNGWTQTIRVLSPVEDNWPDGWAADLWVGYTYDSQGWYYATTSRGEDSIELYDPGHSPDSIQVYVRIDGRASDKPYYSKLRVIIRGK